MHKAYINLGVVSCTYSPGVWDMEAGGSEVQNQPWIRNDFKASPRPLSQKNGAVNSLNLNWAMFMSSQKRNLARIKSMDHICFLSQYSKYEGNEELVMTGS